MPLRISGSSSTISNRRLFIVSRRTFIVREAKWNGDSNFGAAFSGSSHRECMAIRVHGREALERRSESDSHLSACQRSSSGAPIPLSVMVITRSRPSLAAETAMMPVFTDSAESVNDGVLDQRLQEKTWDHGLSTSGAICETVRQDGRPNRIYSSAA